MKRNTILATKATNVIKKEATDYVLLENFKTFNTDLLGEWGGAMIPSLFLPLFSFHSRSLYDFIVDRVL